MSRANRAAAGARGALRRLARPAGRFDARRYFRGDTSLRFYNVGTTRVRALARSIYATHRDEWSPADATAFAEALIADPHLEVKGLAVEVLACYRRAWTPRALPIWRRWLARHYASNWATTDAICGCLVGPLIVAYPRLAARMTIWARDRNMWVRRASAVTLVPSARRGAALDVAYRVARALHADGEDLIQKAAGWLLREAGKTDPRRLERYLRRLGPTIPRTTLRYAIERMPEARRRAILAATRHVHGR